MRSGRRRFTGPRLPTRPSVGLRGSLSPRRLGERGRPVLDSAGPAEPRGLLTASSPLVPGVPDRSFNPLPPPRGHTHPPSNCLAPMKKGGPGVGVVPVLVWGGFSPGFRWKLGEGRAGYRAPRGAVVGPGSAGSPPHRCRSRLRLPRGQARGVRRPLAAGA